jgi:hypothetical protein
MHEDAADRVHSLPALSIPEPAGHFVRLADRVGVATRERELGRVVEHEDRPVYRTKRSLVA